MVAVIWYSRIKLREQAQQSEAAVSAADESDSDDDSDDAEKVRGCVCCARGCGMLRLGRCLEY